jgi:flagellar hook assembly protein FlgD
MIGHTTHRWRLFANELEIFSIIGQEVKTSVDKSQEAGYHMVDSDGRDSRDKELSSGVYFYRIEAGGISRQGQGDFVQTEKMLLLR